MGKIENFISDLRQKPFIKSLITDLKSDVYVVGGAARDLILNKPNKDIDLIVRNIPIDTLISHLQKFGRVDVVGKSFGVLKFIDSDGVDYDLALPRREKPSGEGGYRGFEIQSDENLPIEDDLIRRDARFNAMAININTGKFIDPLGGLEDIEKKQISAANPDAFSDDPLRMLRMTAFASRFGFTIEPETMQMIIDNAHRVKEIAPERILTEFDKIIRKGTILIGVELLINTGLFEQIFGVKMKPSMLGRRDFDGVRTMGEFIFLMTYGIVQQPAAFFKERLKGDLDSFKEIKALEQAFDNADAENNIVARTIAHNMYVISQQSLQSQILPTTIETAAQELLQGKYPKTVNELAVNGGDLMQAGLKGKEIGDAQKMMLLKIYSDVVKNNKEELLSLLDGGKNLTKEGVGDKYAKKKWGISDEDDEIDRIQMDINQKKYETPYGYVRRGRDVIPVFKNPMSLKNFENNVRVISDFNGNLFVAQMDDSFNHGTMAKSIKLFDDSMAVYDNTSKFVLLNRIGSTNSFGLSDSSDDFSRSDIYRQKGVLELLVRAKKMNPQYNYFPMYYQDIKSNNGIASINMNNGSIVKPIDLNEGNENQVAYSAVVLDEVSKQKLIKVFSKMIPEGWEIIAHHQTINLGAIDPKYAKDLGKEIVLSVIDYAIDDKVFAVGVDGYPTNNKKAHITLAVNRQGGGKPMMSNNLENWRPIGFPLVLKGIVTQVKR